MREYAPTTDGLRQVVIWPPAIDPLMPKNMALSPEDASYIVDQFGIDVERPLLTQVSRFDPWKDPLGVIDAYRAVKERFPEVQLALVGSMAHDDPEGWDYYNRTVEHADGDPDIYILSNMNNVGAVEVNAFQVHSDAVVQKSTKEGFGLTVTEALWKGRPMVAGRVGGIVAQIEDGRDRLARRQPRGVRRGVHRDPPRARRGARARAPGQGIRAPVLPDPAACSATGSCSSTASPATTPARARSSSSEMTQRRSLIVVSNRGPVTYDRDAAGARVARRGAGGLVTALRGLVQHHDVTWIASATTDEDRVVAAEGGTDGVVLVAHDPAAYDGYYNVVANPLLWFIQHSLWGLGTRPELDESTHRAWRDGYVRVNQSFAEAVVAELDNKPDATVFFHDYHLYLAPALVRAARPDATLAHFVHIPWPTDWSSCRPTGARRHARGPARERRRRLPHRALGDATSCAAATTCSARGRARASSHHADLDRRRPSSTRSPRATPCSSASERRRDAAGAADRARRPHRSVEEHRPRLPRVRPAARRGIREWHGRVTMLALLDPSRQSIPEYVAYRAAIERAATGCSTSVRPPRLAADRPADRRRLPAARSRRTSSTTCCS